MEKTSQRSGFTLVELVMVVVIIGVLSAIIVPKYVDYVGKSEAATTKANLQSLRSAIQNYRAENGAFPSPLSDLTINYLPDLPVDGTEQQKTVVAAVDGTGGWVYDSATGAVKPNLAGADYNGVNYSDY